MKQPKDTEVRACYFIANFIVTDDNAPHLTRLKLGELDA